MLCYSYLDNLSLSKKLISRGNVRSLMRIQQHRYDRRIYTTSGKTTCRPGIQLIPTIAYVFTSLSSFYMVSYALYFGKKYNKALR